MWLLGIRVTFSRCQWVNCLFFGLQVRCAIQFSPTVPVSLNTMWIWAEDYFKRIFFSTKMSQISENIIITHNFTCVIITSLAHLLSSCSATDKTLAQNLSVGNISLDMLCCEISHWRSAECDRSAEILNNPDVNIKVDCKHIFAWISQYAPGTKLLLVVNRILGLHNFW